MLPVMLMVIGLTFTSCNDDDEPNKFEIGVPITFQGTLTIDTNDGEDPMTVNQDLIITPESQTTCQFALNKVDLFGNPDTAFDIVTTDVKMTRDGDNIVYSGSDEFYFDIAGVDTPVPVSITVTATEDKNGNIHETTEAYVMNRRHVTCTFVGKRK